MRIVATMHKMYLVKELMEEIHIKYNRIIKEYIKANNMIVLLNGDTIRAYPESTRMDGLRADILVGTDSAYITCRSKLINPVWGIEQLYKYLDYVQEAIDECFKGIERNLINETIGKQIMEDVSEM